MNNTNPMMMKNTTMMTPTMMMMLKAPKSLSVVKAGGNKSSPFTRLMMKTTAIPYPTGNTEHHLRIRDKNFAVAAAAKATATTTRKRTTRTIVGPGLGDPCLDLYFGIQPDTPRSQKYSLLKKLLPAAWSHNPLTTLKLICNLLEFSSRLGIDSDSFNKAAVWLHHNHPKTLASNLRSIFGESNDTVGLPSDLPEILYLLRKSGTRVSESEDYRLLQDRASDLLADYLRRNVQDMYKKKQPLTHWDWEHCILPDSGFHLISLEESIAKKLFPRESYPEYQGLEESLYTDAVRERLWAEVVAPLTKYGRPPRWKNSKAAGPESLPHEIIKYANCEDNSYTGVAQAQLDWERMVEDVYLKQRKFKHCLVVCNTKDRKDPDIDRDDILHDNVVLSLAILVSQLSGGPWKGKVITSGRNPKLRNMPSNLDLVSKCAFLRRKMDGSHGVDIPKVFDLVLQAAVNANLRPNQMVKKVFLVTTSRDFDDLTSSSWDSDYEAIVAKYKEKGYDQDAVPQIVLWRMCNYWTVEVPRSRPGVATLAGFSNNLFKSFLDNDGRLGPHHVMEVAISGPKYQDLVVVD